MEGRVFGMKKSIVLLAVAISMFFCFITMLFLSIFLFKLPSLWFFSFCACVGIYELTKSVLFNIDSSLYLGSLLTSIAFVGFFCLFSSNMTYFPVLIPACFCFSSITVFLFFKQRFHLIHFFYYCYYFLLYYYLHSLDFFFFFCLDF